MKQKEDGLLQQNHPRAKESDTSIPSTAEKVKPSNPLRDLRLQSGTTAKDMVEVVQTIYPKYDKTLQSKCENGDDYGVRLMDDALAALYAHFNRQAPEEAVPQHRKDRHNYTSRVQCRLPKNQIRLLQRLLIEDGLTIQRWLENVIDQYIRDKTQR